MIFRNAPRGRTILDMVLGSWQNTQLQVLAAYGDFQDQIFGFHVPLRKAKNRHVGNIVSSPSALPAQR